MKVKMMMPIVRGWKTEMKPTPEQKGLFMKACGIARFAFNWGLAWKENAHQYNQLPHSRLKNPSAIDLHKELNRLKKEKFPWMYDVTKQAPQEALRNLDNAFLRFFKGEGGHPKFKSRSRDGIGSFACNDGITVTPTSIILPTIGEVRLKEHGYLPSQHILSATVSERAGRWFVSVRARTALPAEPNRDGKTAGHDLGIYRRATTVSDDGVKFVQNPRPMKRYQKLRAFLQRKLARQKDGSERKRKTQIKYERVEARIANIRNDTTEKFTTEAAKAYEYNCLEDLEVSNMMKNHHLAGAIQDAAFYETRRQMEYKCRWYGSELVYPEEGTWFASTGTCPKCKRRVDMPLSKRTFVCPFPDCGYTGDRDVVGATNLRDVALSCKARRMAALVPNKQTPRREVSGAKAPVPVNEASTKPAMAHNHGSRVGQ